jgi:hypothetical protein
VHQVGDQPRLQVMTLQNVITGQMRIQNVLSFFLFCVQLLYVLLKVTLQYYNESTQKLSLIYIFGCTNQWTSMNYKQLTHDVTARGEAFHDIRWNGSSSYRTWQCYRRAELLHYSCVWLFSVCCVLWVTLKELRFECFVLFRVLYQMWWSLESGRHSAGAACHADTTVCWLPETAGTVHSHKST